MSHDRERLQGQPVLVTGADGFIGARLVERLTALGARVGALVRRRGDRGAGDSVAYHEADLGGGGLEDAVRGVAPRFAFHLAAYTNPAREAGHAREAMAVNLLGTMRLLDALRGGDSGHFSFDSLFHFPPPSSEGGEISIVLSGEFRIDRDTTGLVEKPRWRRRQPGRTKPDFCGWIARKPGFDLAGSHAGISTAAWPRRRVGSKPCKAAATCAPLRSPNCATT